MTRLYPYIIAILIMVIALLVIFSNNKDTYYEERLQKEKNERRQTVKRLEQELLLSEQQGLVLNHRIDSLNIRYKNVIVDLDRTTKELKDIKGRYKNHTPTELEKEMLKRFNESK
jgi:predicted RND superfamily exporter protein